MENVRMERKWLGNVRKTCFGEAGNFEQKKIDLVFLGLQKNLQCLSFSVKENDFWLTFLSFLNFSKKKFFQKINQIFDEVFWICPNKFVKTLPFLGLKRNFQLKCENLVF